MITLTKISFDKLETLAAGEGLRLPVEQTAAWAAFERTVPGRSPWGVVRIDDEHGLLGVASFYVYETHGYRYLRAHHAPVWTRELSEDEERAAVAAMREGVAKMDRRIAFIRMAVEHDLDITEPVLSTLPYDTTVVVDLTGGEDGILSRMKPRGRRDVRKSLRECPAECSDETEAAAADFSDYHRIMRETGERDGFVPAPREEFENMVRALGPDHCRVYAGRIEGELVAWSLVTMNDGRATRYYAATTHEAGRKRVADKLVFFECCRSAELGCSDYDLMGIGSDFSPETKNLNEFKGKFAKEVTHIAPDRDVPVKLGFYGALRRAKGLRDGLNERRRAREETSDRGWGVPARNDILPVMLGGDISVYALAREFHEAYGVESICLVPAPIALIKHSRIVRPRIVSDLEPDSIVREVNDIARFHPDKKVILMANTDALVDAAERARDRLDAGVVCPLPPHDLMTQVSDKVEFEKLCARYGLDTTSSEVVRIIPGLPSPEPTKIPFPLIAKPAVSSAYSHLYEKGFKKVYFIREQAELDRLWRDLAEASFEGDFLVQELIEGDDTYVDMITVYVDTRGKATMFAGAQVLLEDHSPSLFGNPVAMYTRPMPELWSKVGKMLEDIGWRGFANFDLKRDRRDGRAIFMDFNPRIGRNSYYCCAGGVNPMISLVSDVIDGKPGRLVRMHDNALYTLVPPAMLDRYLLDQVLAGEVHDAIAQRRVFNPTMYSADSLASRLYAWAMDENQRCKFERVYPKPTDTAF